MRNRVVLYITHKKNKAFSRFRAGFPLKFHFRILFDLVKLYNVGKNLVKFPKFNFSKKIFEATKLSDTTTSKKIKGKFRKMWRTKDKQKTIKAIKERQ